MSLFSSYLDNKCANDGAKTAGEAMTTFEDILNCKVWILGIGDSRGEASGDVLVAGTIPGKVLKGRGVANRARRDEPRGRLGLEVEGDQ